ncbi:SipW-dependent-type signal peptide-containing protein [Microbacterium sp. Marseille-Q6965]|uniref:SipW-dependent-type signal peptide-containing protein n=1 Tax=Microbacterium sp. Marseille-Q6965 TaxID=2965072 RepID=UPI0021B82E71|nr:SipW-dependent-type signal peptide-containing protein [Microbacterium sp. Marseille-Q6965]
MSPRSPARHAATLVALLLAIAGATTAAAGGHAETSASWTDRAHVTAPVTSGTWDPGP